jgi:hypothetical protein
MGSHVATTISPTNQSYATRKGASSYAGAARAALAARGRRQPCWGAPGRAVGAVTEPPKVLGPPTVVLVLTTLTTL